MKKRIKIDSSLLSFIIILTGFLYLFPELYGGNQFFDSLFDVLGMIGILKGVMLRMVARGYKKANSKKGDALVVEGLYTLTRNPMYLGSFLLGAGFVLIVWPWWALPFFAGLFYLRFNKQMLKEEAHLTKLFGKDYQEYCRKVPRIFPSIQSCLKVKLNNIINLKQAFSTKEKRGLLGWPLLAIILESFQEVLVFGSTDIWKTITVFGSAVLIFLIGFAWKYYRS